MWPFLRAELREIFPVRARKWKNWARVGIELEPICGRERSGSPLAKSCAKDLRPATMFVKELEARVGIEPTNRGFADLCLTTWLPRPTSQQTKSPHGLGDDENWSGRRDLNPRLRPWQGRTLPLSYSRPNIVSINDPIPASNVVFIPGQRPVSAGLSGDGCPPARGWLP